MPARMATATLCLAVLAGITSPAIGQSMLDDPGFERPALASGLYQYAPSDSAWTFSRGAGISADATAFTRGNPSAPEGRQVAFLQNGGSFQQTVYLPVAGYYGLDFKSAQRANWSVGRRQQTVRLLVDDQLVAEHQPPTFGYSDAYYTFYAQTGSHRITFAGSTVSGDATAFVDDVTLALRSWGFWDPGLFSGGVKSAYPSLVKGTRDDPPVLPTPCLWADDDPLLIPNITCKPEPTVYESSFPFWQNTTWTDKGPYWVFAVNNEPSQNACNPGLPNLSLPRASPGSGIAGFIVLTDTVVGERFNRAHLVLNQFAGTNPCEGGITYMSFGAEANRGNGHPVVAINPSDAPSRIRFTAKLWAFEANSPSWFRLVMLSAWPDGSGRWVPRQVQLNLFAGGRDHLRRSHWNWPLADDFFAHGGAEIVAVDGDALSSLCGVSVPILESVGEEVAYTIDVDRIFHCLSDTGWFSDPIPAMRNIAVTGVHWAVENASPPTVEHAGVIWVSVHGTDAF